MLLHESVVVHATKGMVLFNDLALYICLREDFCLHQVKNYVYQYADFHI